MIYGAGGVRRKLGAAYRRAPMNYAKVFSFEFAPLVGLARAEQRQ
jgi:hypothetical protein